MRAVDAMILWTPNREPFLNYPSAGRVSVTTIPEPDEMRIHPMSVGACDQNWRDADEGGRQKLMQRYFTQMLHRDNISEDQLYTALSIIDGFDASQFSTAVPEGDDWR